jgi:ABC-2 type transport system ATP-binding protein
VDSDATLRALLAATGAYDIEVTAHNLEDAFIALTAKDSASAPPGGTPDRIQAAIGAHR